MSGTNHNVGPAIPVAIVGMGCIFPKSPGLKEYWRLLVRGEDAITEVPETHWSPADYYDKDPSKPDHVYCKRGGFISPFQFDPSEFGIPPSSLEATDTSQLLGLVAAKAALADAGYLNREFDRERASVILGVTGTQELVIPLGARLGHPKWRKALKEAGVDPTTAEDVVRRISDAYVPWRESSFPGLLGNVVAGRICNRLDFGGTNCAVDAACASSLSAVHLALMELEAHKSDMVITGGVDMLNDIFMHMCFSKTQILSPTGDARPFSKDADGTVLGEGIGMLALKRLADAEKDGDRIYAVIKGLGSSSDGKSQSIYAPRPEGQAKALNAAYRVANVDPATVGMIETHGTGTRVGDLVEVRALKQVFGQGSESGSGAQRNGDRCAIGSVKSMIGHTKASAGAAGLIKAALAIYHKVLPPTLKADKPDDRLEIEDSPFYLNTQTRPWFSKSSHPRRSGVSSFGFGGSNFHIVLEEHLKNKAEIAWDGSVDIAAVSAASVENLRDLLMEIKSSLENGMADKEMAVEFAKSRTNFSPDHGFRMLLVRENLAGPELFAKALDALDANRNKHTWNVGDIFFGSMENPGKLAFVFPGQGSQYVGMGRDFVCRFPHAFDIMEQANGVFDKKSRLTDIIFPYPVTSEKEKRVQEETLRGTRVAQPAIGAVSLAMAGVLSAFGVVPEAVAGHSYGELTALHVAGRTSVDDFLGMSVVRGASMAATGDEDTGTMLAVSAPLAELAELTRDSDVILANKNSHAQGVLSGPYDAIVDAEERCRQNGWRTKRLPVSAAFHSRFVENAREPFSQALGEIRFAPSKIPVFSNVTGKPYPDDEQQARTLLSDQIVNPVDFVGEIENMYDFGVRTFVEIGPKTVLTGLVDAILKEKPDVHTLATDSSSGRRNGMADLARALCCLGSLGYPVELENWEGRVVAPVKQRMRVPLSGANYRSVSDKKMPQKPPITPFEKAVPALADKKTADVSRHQPVAPAPKQTQTEAPIIKAMEVRKVQNNHHVIVNSVAMNNNQNNTHPIVVENALKVLQEGLKSMQSLQTQTAHVHQKFLETQTEASRTLQMMMTHTQRLAEASMGYTVPDMSATAGNLQIPLPTTPPPPMPTEHVVPEILAAPAAEPPAAPLPAKFLPAEPVVRVAENTSQSENVGQMRTDLRATIESALLAVVSELTGYPVETIELDMDIEADLGIDSIKRVEILSAVEEKMPHLPAVSPEIMGSLRTLAQVAGYLMGGEPGGAALVGDAHTSTAHPPAYSNADDSIKTALLDIVAELTGYPTEMLSTDMDIEADLGIDSIKRVEILSALEEKMPHLPPVSPEIMGTLRTLAQIIDYLGGGNNSAAPKSSAPECPASEAPIVPATDGPSVESTLLETVSDLTGYPVEMLSMDMDIEADLGIDSIKRVEILSAIEEKMPHLPPVSPEIIGTLRTLGQIAGYLTKSPNADAPEKTSEISTSPALSTEPSLRSTSEVWPQRNIIKIVNAPSGDPIRIPAGGKIYVATDDTGLGQAIIDEFRNLEIDTEALSGSTDPNSSPVAGLVIISKNDGAVLRDAFEAAKQFGPALMESAKNGGALFATVSRLDGAFGFAGKGLSDPLEGFPLHGGLSGLAKTAAAEWEGVSCRALDIDPDWTDHAKIAQAVVQTLLITGPVEIGLGPNRKITTVLESVSYPDGDIDISQNDVVVISGGARGVTASAAVALAKRVKPVIVLLGRSPEPSPEPAWLSPISDQASVKKAILAHEFGGKPTSPKELEKSFKTRMANREITKTLDRIRSAGASATYHSVDVRDAQRVKSIVDSARSAHGPVRAVIHGAGTLEDRLIVDKTSEQFEAVFSTKVDGLAALLAAVEPDDLKYLVLFSSVAARFGNKGQADYAMANEVLNKIAHLESAKRPNCRVVSINWGPWDGGMVSPALKREFEKRGIDLIPIDAGAECMLAEMGGKIEGPVEVVIGAKIVAENISPDNTDMADETDTENLAETPTEALVLSFKREIDVDACPILSAHVLDGKPVVPFALLAEWIGHGALHGNPGLVLHGLDDMRILRGVKVDGEKKLIRLLAGKARKNGPMFEVDVELRDGVKEGREVIHSRAKAILADGPYDPPAFDRPLDAPSEHEPQYSRSMDDVYENILFHGGGLRGIREITACTDKLMIAKLASAPAPEQWMKEPFRSKWIADPLVLDSAFQMAIVWCFEQCGVVSLPSYSSSYRQYCHRFPTDGVTAYLKIRDVTKRKMVGDFTFVDSENRVVASLSGSETVMDESLFKAFKRRQIEA